MLQDSASLQDVVTRPSPEIAAPQDAENSPRSQGVTLRVTILCLLLACLFGYVIPIIDVRLQNTFLGAAHLPPGAIAVLLFVLLLLNPILRVLGTRFMLSRNETLTVYISCLFSCLVPGHGSENFFIGSLVAPFYYAKPENKWLDFLVPYLKPWFTPALNAGGGKYNDAGRSVVDAWYTGVRPGETIPFSAWILPLALWGAFVFASYIMLGCLGVMLRAQWGEKEALAFPLLRLPMEMTEDVDAPLKHGVLGRFFKSPTMWVGFGIAVFVQLMNGLNLYFPDVPQIPLSINTSSLFTEAPWNQMGGLVMNVFPIVVGVTYLLTAEVSLSLWFFYLFIKLQLIVAYMTGFLPSTLPNPVGFAGVTPKSFTMYQTVGAFLVYVAIVMWTGREHFKHIFKRATGRAASTREEQKEAMSYPFAFWGFVLSFLFLVGWSFAAGMSLSVALALWLTYLVIALALTRVIVEGGLLFVQQGWTPLGTFAQIFNSGPGKWLAPNSIVPGTFIQTGMMTDLRAFLLPSFVQSFKLASDRGINARKLIWLIFAVIAITMVMGFYMNVMLGYKNGGLSLNSWFAVAGAQAPANNSKEMIEGVRDASYLNAVWLAIGGLVTFGMIVARSRLLWFPLHPIGYLMCLSYPMYTLWFSIFLGWLCKVLISRFGGTDTYRKLIPAFLGLALGDVAMMLFWLMIDGFFGRVSHQLMPG